MYNTTVDATPDTSVSNHNITKLRPMSPITNVMKTTRFPAHASRTNTNTSNILSPIQQNDIDAVDTTLDTVTLDSLRSK